MSKLAPSLVALALLGAAASSPAQELTERSYERLKRKILPQEDEGAWTGVPWRAAFGAAVAEAREKGKPVLLWAMNGHPLGCT